MTIDDKSRDEKYNMILTQKQQNYQLMKILGKNDKYEYLTGAEILPSDQS